MSPVHDITARDLFLAHHWQKYPPFDRQKFEGFKCGRIALKEDEAVVLEARCDVPSDSSVLISKWFQESLRESKAAKMVPPLARDVLSVGDWVGVSEQGEVVLFAPCISDGNAACPATMLHEAQNFCAQAYSWSEFLATVRRFFTDRSFTEMTTPALAPSPGTEPFLDPLAVLVEADGGSVEKYLITSPEFHLKKSLAAGIPRVFEIAKCFRNKESGEHHRVEFYMLEWYRSFSTLVEIADDVEALIETLSASRINLKRITMRDLFREVFRENSDFELRPGTTRSELSGFASSLGVRIVEDDSFDDIFHRIFLEKIEPLLLELNQGGPVLISGYPPSMAALSRIGEDGFADRFEVYWQGLELCNAFHELNDPIENRKRFETDNETKKQSGRPAVPLDHDLLRCFDLGVPPAGGIALGLERLYMALHGISNIAKVRPFA